jgi:alpha-tubulin suppressor-like RCC1 family protein
MKYQRNSPKTTIIFLALLSDGSVMSWGWNNDGSLGLHSSDDNSEDISGVFCDPTLVTCLPLGVDCKQISAGARHSAFIGSNDHVWLCGSNKYGQLGPISPFSIEKNTSICCTSWFTLLN